MANLSQSQATAMNRRFGYLNSAAANNVSAANAAAATLQQTARRKSAEQLILELLEPDLRADAILELSKVLQKERIGSSDLGALLWHSFGCIAALLQEIVSIYPYLWPPNLTLGASNRVCNALTLLQSVASHSEVRSHFLDANIPYYIYPFLTTTSRATPFDHIRLSSLGVIGALVKDDGVEAISFLLRTEITPLCLRAMDVGSDLSKTVATFILDRILMDEAGLKYIVDKPQRFYALCQVLANMVASCTEQPPIRLLRHIIRCYLSLSEYPRAGEALRDRLPRILRDATVSQYLHNDPSSLLSLQKLLRNVYGARMLNIQPGGGIEHLLAG